MADDTPTDSTESPVADRSQSDDQQSTDGSSPRAGSDATVLDRPTLSDLLVNAVPIGIIVAFVLMFGLASSGGAGGDPLLLFHGALIVGVVLVSYVSARVIAGTGAPLTGSAGTPDDAEDD